MKKLVSVAKFFFSVALGLILLWLALRNLSWNNVIEGLKHANYVFIFFAIIISVLSHYIRAARWNLLIEPLDHKVSNKNSFIAVLIGYMVNFAVPRMGEVSRCVIINRSDKVPLNKLIGTVFIERLFDTLVLLLIIVLTLFIQFKRYKDLVYDFLFKPIKEKYASTSFIFWIVGIAILIILIVVIIYVFKFIKHKSKSNRFFEKLHSILSGFFSGIKTIFHMEKKWRFIIFTIGIWTCYLFMAYILFFTTDATSILGLNAALAVLAIGSVGMVIPSPGGIGSWHYAAILSMKAYKPLGMPDMTWKNDCAIYTIISHESQMVLLILIGAIAYLYFIVSLRKSKKDENIPKA